MILNWWWSLLIDCGFELDYNWICDYISNLNILRQFFFVFQHQRHICLLSVILYWYIPNNILIFVIISINALIMLHDIYYHVNDHVLVLLHSSTPFHTSLVNIPLTLTSPFRNTSCYRKKSGESRCDASSPVDSCLRIWRF